MAVDWDAAVLAPLMGVFGEDVAPTYQPKAGGSFAIEGVFDRAYREIVIDAGAAGGIGYNTVVPVLGVRLADFASPPVQGDKVTIPSVGNTYVVNNVQPDGHGWALLKLNQVSP